MTLINSAKTGLKQALATLQGVQPRNRLWNARHRKTKLVMYHLGRCGSSVLADMLNQHPQVYWAGEIFDPFHYGTKKTLFHGKRLMDWQIDISSHSQQSEIFGMELKYLSYHHLNEHVLNTTMPECITRLRELGFDQSIVLHRNNYLRRAISAQIGMQTKKWHTSKTADAPTKIRFKLHGKRMSQLEEFRDVDRQHQQLLKLLENTSLLKLSYEEDVAKSPHMGYQKICDFLNIPAHEPEIRLQKTNPFTYEELVENWPEVQEMFRDTEYSWMLED